MADWRLASMGLRLTGYVTPRLLRRLSTGLSVAAIGGALAAAFTHQAGQSAPHTSVPIEILRTRPAPVTLPRKGPDPPQRQTN